MRTTQTQKGFTLIELLVVISIIALLSSVVIASLQGARSRARDTKRVAETRSVEQALTLYAFDHNGLIPYSTFQSMDDVPKTSSGAIDCVSRTPSSNYANTNGLFDILVAGKYLSTKPGVDPLESLGYCYVYITSNQSLAGVEYDAGGKLVGATVAVVPGTTARHAVFFAPSENSKTNSGNNALVGISYGSTPPITLNVDLTTGMKHNTSSYSDTSGNSGSGT